MNHPITHIIFLIHPGCYEALPPDSPLWECNIELFSQRERQVKQRWLAELDRRTAGRASHGTQPATLLLQLYGPRELLAAAQDRLGEAGACYVQADWDSILEGPDRMRDYYNRLAACIRQHLDAHQLTYDPARVTSEIWGESFEGCAATYGSAFAERLGLGLPPRMRFDMTVYDARFLHEAKGPEVIRIGATDIEALLFELHDTTSAAIFQTRLKAQLLDRRRVRLALDPGRVQICTTSGFTLWPEQPLPRLSPQEPVPVSFSPAEMRWVRGIGMSAPQLRQVLAAATVETTQPLRERVES